MVLETILSKMQLDILNFYVLLGDSTSSYLNWYQSSMIPFNANFSQIKSKPALLFIISCKADVTYNFKLQVPEDELDGQNCLHS